MTQELNGFWRFYRRRLLLNYRQFLGRAAVKDEVKIQKLRGSPVKSGDLIIFESDIFYL